MGSAMSPNAVLLAYKTALTKRLTGNRIPTFLVRQEAVKFSA